MVVLERVRRGSRLLAVSVAVGAVVVSAAGCGGEGSEPAARDGSASAADEAQVRQAFAGFEASLQAGDVRAACGRLTESAQAEAATHAPSGGEATCQRALEQFAQGVGDLEQKPSKVLSVDVRGNRATASISDAGRPAATLPFEKVNGEWKLDGLGAP